MSGILRLESLTKGNTLRQGDLTLLKYRLFDADGDKLDISGKSATVRLMKNDFTLIAYEKEGLTVAPDDTISFNINKILPGGLYHLEVIVDDRYIFPSRADEGKFNVDKSSLGAELTIIENAGIDAVVRKAVDLINDDPNLIIDEDKLVNDIISNTGIGSINDYYQAFDDLKPKAELSISQSAEALTKSQNALNVANGIDAKATNALSLSESADTLSKSVQEQFNQVVIDGDSSVEAAQARVDASGQSNPTLKARLDKEHNEVTAQLAHMESSPISKTKMKLWQKQPVTISAFGDSVTQGYISSTEQSETNYPKVLQDKLRYIYEYDEITVVNRGYPGETTEDALSRYDEVVADNPDLVLIMFGLNDRGQRITFEDFGSNLRQLTTQFKDDGVEVILMSNTPSIMGNGIDGQSENYRKALKTLATEQVVEYIDVYAESMKLWDSGHLTSADYVPTIHLYDYTFIADIVLKERLADVITIEASEGKSVPMFSPHVNRGLLGYGAQPNSKYQSYVHTSASTPSNLRFGIYATKPFYLNFEGVVAPSSGSNILRDFGTEITTIDLYSTASNTTYKVPAIYIAEPGYHFFEFKGGEATATFRLNGFDISYSQKMQGTWKPVIKGTSGTFANTYSVANGQYSIIGNLAFVSFDVKLTSLDSGMAGSTLISGLPFTSPVGTVVNSMALARYSGVTTSSALAYQINPNSSNIYITEINNSESVLTATSKLTANTRLSASFVMLV